MRETLRGPSREKRESITLILAHFIPSLCKGKVEGVSDQFNTAIHRLQFYCNDIESRRFLALMFFRKIMKRYSRYFPLFRMANSQLRVSVCAGTSALDFGKNEGFPILSHDIDLTEDTAIIPLEDPVASL